jgi:hypothetical protein
MRIVDLQLFCHLKNDRKKSRQRQNSGVGRSKIGQDRNCAVLILAEILLNMENEHRFQVMTPGGIQDSYLEFGCFDDAFSIKLV